MILSLEAFKTFLEENPGVKTVQRFIRKHYLVYESAGNAAGDVLFTGYFEPTYEGSLEQSRIYSTPVFKKPEDLLEIDLSAFSDQYKGHKRLMARMNQKSKRVVPYYTREQINTQADFIDRAEPIVWLKSRVDRFFLEIQGSGRVTLDQGGELRVHYAGSNGNAYRSIGRNLIEKKESAKEYMSMQAIRTWLQFHPDRIDEVLRHNESFVFFQTEQGGPFGSLGVKVTAFRSLATDRKLFPGGALCFLSTKFTR